MFSFKTNTYFVTNSMKLVKRDPGWWACREIVGTVPDEDVEWSRDRIEFVCWCVGGSSTDRGLLENVKMHTRYGN